MSVNDDANWLSALPIAKHKDLVHKAEFIGCAVVHGCERAVVSFAAALNPKPPSEAKWWPAVALVLLNFAPAMSEKPYNGMRLQIGDDVVVVARHHEGQISSDGQLMETVADRLGNSTMKRRTKLVA
jgi:hypothetical protein